jgi:hypothetical protein
MGTGTVLVNSGGGAPVAIANAAMLAHSMPPLVHGVEAHLLDPNELANTAPPPPLPHGAAAAQNSLLGSHSTHQHDYEASIGLSTLMAEPSMDHFGGSIMGLHGIDTLFSDFETLDDDAATTAKRKAHELASDDVHGREKHSRTRPFSGIGAVH